MRRFALLIGGLVLAATPTVAADLPAVFAKRSVRAGALVTAADVELRPLPEHRTAGVATSLDAVVGQEVRRNLYVDRRLLHKDMGVPPVFRRNSLVTLAYPSGS